MSHKRIKFFTGAPEAGDLDWSEDGLLKGSLPAFEPRRTGASTLQRTNSPTACLQSNWRHIILNGAAFVQTPINPNDLKTDHRRPVSSITDVKDDFIEHSLAVLDNLQSSQLAPHVGDESTTAEDTTFVTFDSFVTSNDETVLSEGSAANSVPLGQQQAVDITGPISHLNSVPSAKHLLQTRPQTITINLIVGIISVSTARTVHVKRGDYDMDVLEITVGDDTQAGFSISVWLNPQTSPRKNGAPASDTDLRKAVEKLRPGDVVYVGRLALTTFNGKVYGQTLNRKASRVITRFIPIQLEQSMLDKTPADLTTKIGRVTDWVDNFIGAPNRQKRKRKLEDASLQDDVKRTGKQVIQQRDWLPDDSPS
ncbi:hypothetical protein B9Z65_5758 [Elsinoe australis]|uniref:Uncharacterized protein n=1 Tax=Elsinoe australis TaxID=40998 RepID=A0A2P7YIY7_9PEZI|nr:hypothetical protein B9Z65_5758 [Elsinoe australis]